MSGAPLAGPAITISNQAGAGAHEIATQLAGLMQAGEPKGTTRWTLFDRNLIEKVLEDHHLPQTLAEILPEERRSLIQDTIDDLMGLRPSSWALRQHVTETVLHLVAAGRVILVGRGSNFHHCACAKCFSRPLGRPAAHAHRAGAGNQPLDIGGSRQMIKQADGGRSRYVKDNFHVSVDDVLLYHLVVNTEGIPGPDAAQLIADGARRYFRSGAGGPMAPTDKSTASSSSR